METVLIIMTFGSFLVLWVTVLFFYTPATFNLREMLDSIDETGNLTRTKAPWTAYLTNLETAENWFMTLPTTANYLKYDEVKLAVQRVKKLRQIMYRVGPVLLVGFILLMVKLDK